MTGSSGYISNIGWPAAGRTPDGIRCPVCQAVSVTVESRLSFRWISCTATLLTSTSHPRKGGQPAALDVTVISTNNHRDVFYTRFHLESIGGWSDRAIDTIKSLGRLSGQPRSLEIPPADSTTHLFQRLAIITSSEAQKVMLSDFFPSSQEKLKERVSIRLSCQHFQEGSSYSNSIDYFWFI